MESKREKKEEAMFLYASYVVEVATVIIAVFMCFVKEVPWVVIVICIALAVLLGVLTVKYFVGKQRLIGAVIGLGVIVGFLCCVIYMRENKIPSDITTGKLESTFDEVILLYDDGHGSKALTCPIEEELEIENMEFRNDEYDAEIDTYELVNNILTVEKVPLGNLKADIKLKNYDRISERMKLNGKDMKDGEWKKTFSLQKEVDFKNFSIKILDRYNSPLKDFSCEVQIHGTDKKTPRVVIDKNGELPYTFSCSEEHKIDIILYDEKNNYTKTIDINTISETAEVCFKEVLSKQSLETEEYKKKREELKKKAEEAESTELKSNPRSLLKSMDHVDVNIEQKGTCEDQRIDRLTEEEREKIYTFSVGRAGPYWIEFNHANLIEDSYAWSVYVDGSDGETYLEFDSSMNREKTFSDIVGLECGTYNIRVESSNSFSDAEYQLNLMTADGFNYEKENNKEELSSNAQQFPELKDNTVETYLGNLSYYGDVDYYSVQLQSPGVIAFRFEHENLTEDEEGWKITVKNAESEVLTEFFSNWQTVSVFSPNIGLKEGTYYIEVKAGNSFNSSVYALSTAFHPSDRWEKEFNDEIGDAKNGNGLIEGFYQYGSLSYYGDEDYYSVTCEKTGSYVVTFEHDNLTEDDSGWCIQALDESSNSLWDENLVSMLRDIKVSKTVQLKKGKLYYFLVKSANQYYNDDYKLRFESKN